MSKVQVIIKEAEENFSGFKPKETPEPRLTRGRKKILETKSQPVQPPTDTSSNKKETINTNRLNKEIQKLSTLVKDVKAEQNFFSNKVTLMESLNTCKIKPKVPVNCTDEEKMFHTMRFLTVVLVSMMYDEDKKIIGYEKLLKLFRAYRYGVGEVQLELASQGCRPSLQLISYIEKVMENPVEASLRQFLMEYRNCSDKGNVQKLKALLKYKQYKHFFSGLVVGMIILCILYFYFKWL